jgi:hypothetical protein
MVSLRLENSTGLGLRLMRPRVDCSEARGFSHGPVWIPSRESIGKLVPKLPREHAGFDISRVSRFAGGRLNNREIRFLGTSLVVGTGILRECA